MVTDPADNAVRRGDDRVVATFETSSGGNAVIMDDLTVDVLDVDPRDTGGRSDACDFITAFGDNVDPTMATVGSAPTVDVGPGVGSGATGALLANEAQCDYSTVPLVNLPSSDNDDNGTVRISYPANTSRIGIWSDESIGEVRA